MSKTEELLASAPLGKKSIYENAYNPSLLFALPRKPKREEIGVSDELPFQGKDLWTAFEISWLWPSKKPTAAIADFVIPVDSKNIIESKSFKLYLNSFNNAVFDSLEKVTQVMKADLSQACGSEVLVNIYEVSKWTPRFGSLQGTCLDDLDIVCNAVSPDPSLLKIREGIVSETVHTHLLKSNCLITGQPDWGSLEVFYEGKQIDHRGLLQYIISLRNHNEFHEQCVERIFMDIKKYCNPHKLTVYARYTRRGGLDINPYRTTEDLSEKKIVNDRLARQ